MNKKAISYVLVGVFAIALVSAGLISYFGQKQINLSVESPIVLQGNLNESTQLVAGDGYRLYLVEGENKLNRSVPVNLQLTLLDGNGNEVTNTEGFYLAYSDDIQYAYNPNYGNASNWDEAKTWMFNNLDWFDWYATDDYSKYNSSVITNYNGDSFYPSVISYNTAIPESIEPGKFYAVVYLDIDSAVTPGNYTLRADIMPQ